MPKNPTYTSLNILNDNNKQKKSLYKEPRGSKSDFEVIPKNKNGIENKRYENHNNINTIKINTLNDN